MAYNANRKPPTAYCQSPLKVHPDSRDHGRLIVLSTGRGDTIISASEAIQLAASLTAAAEKMVRIMKLAAEMERMVSDGSQADR